MECIGTLFNGALDSWSRKLYDRGELIHDNRIIAEPTEQMPTYHGRGLVKLIDQVPNAVFYTKESADVCLNCKAISCSKGVCARVQEVELNILRERGGRKRRGK